MTLKITGFAHAGIRVHDLERSLKFYEFLGFTKTMGPIGPEPVAILHHPAGIEINLIINAPTADVPNPLMDVPVKAPGYTHIALTVESVEDTAKALEEAGYPISGRMSVPGVMKTVFVRDPDRNVVEFDEKF